MIFTPTEIADVWIIEPSPLEDPRGYFARIFCQRELNDHDIDFDLVQANRSVTKKRGTIRGLHYQRSPLWEPKIVQCVRGSVYNVVVDLRPDSPTFTKWLAVELSEDNRKMVYTPEGFANGCQTLTDNCELLYFMSQFYSPEHATGVRFDDPDIGVAWPISDWDASDKDKQLPSLRDSLKPSLDKS